MPPIITSRRNVARNATTSTNLKTRTTVDRLAEQLTTDLVLSKNVKGKQKAASALSQEEQRANSMRSVNSASQHLSTLFQSGWRHSQEKSTHKSSVLNDALQSASKAMNHLRNLRKLKFCDLDVERAAMSVLAKLVALEMYEPALQIMHDAYPYVCEISRGSTNRRPFEPTKVDRPSNAMLSIPIPAKPPTDITILNLISIYLFNSIAILSYYSNTGQPLKHTALSFETFSNSLLNSSTLLKWIPLFSDLPVKQLDSILTKSYSLLTKLVPSSLKHNSSALVFRVRMYAINCLAYTSQGVIDKPDSFWGQCHKFTSIYAKCEAAGSSQAESFVLTSLAEVVRIAKGRSDRNDFMSGDGFISFCETWTSFANRSGDLESLDRIGCLMKNALMPSSKEIRPSEVGDYQERDRKQLAVDGMRLCNTLAQLSALLNTSEPGLTEEVISRIRVCSVTIEKSTLVDILVCPLDGSDKEMQRVLGKVQRALEKCRRAAIKLLETSRLSCGEYIEVIHKFIEVVVEVMELALKRNPLPDYFSQALDTLFTLARITLSISDPRTYTSAYDYLDKAVTILNVASECSQPLDVSTYMRCTSGAFHNLAGTLYQAGRYGSAIPYLRESCRLGVKAAELHGKCEQNANKDAWKQLEEQLWRRWQLLALCYTKIGDRRASFCALRSCIETFPFQASSFSDRVDKDGLSTLFDMSPSLKDLADIVDRLTHMGTCDLLLPAQEVSLRSIAVRELSIRGALIERQLDSLEAYSHKEVIASVSSELLKDALDIYKESSMPIRSVRVYVRALSFAYYRGAEHVSFLGTLDDIGVIVQKVLAVELDLGRDQGLAPFLAGYQAMAHLWLGLHTHRTADPTQSALIGIHVEKACGVLHSQVLLPVQTTNSLAMKAGKGVSVRQPKVSRSRTKAPTTPKPRGPDLQVNGLKLDINGIHSTTLDYPLKLVEVLQLSSHVLGIMALNFLKIRVLDTLRKISKQHLGTASDAFILASSDLGYEYLLLGKFTRAKNIFELTQTTVRNGGCSDFASSILLLRFAELCALNDDVTQSLELYSRAQVIASHLMEEKQSSFQKLQARIVRLELAAMASNLLATFHFVKNDHSNSLRSLLNSLRLWNRAFDSLVRLQPPPAAVHRRPEDSDPFETSSTSNTFSLVTPQTSDESKKPFVRRTSLSGLEWRIGQGLLHTIFGLGQAYLLRGSSRESQYFAEQARNLAESLNATAFICRATTRLEELRMQVGQLKELNGLDQFDAHPSHGLSIDVAEIYRLRGDFEQRSARIEDAQRHYGAALQVLEESDQVFGKFDLELGSRHSIGSSHGTDLLTPALLIRVLREHIWVLRGEEGEQFDVLLNKFLAIPPTLQSQTEKDALLARLTLHDVYRRSRVDMFLSSIGETTVALPMGTSSTFLASLPPSFQEIMRSLENSEKLFWSQLAAHGQSGYVPDIRTAISSIVLIRTFQASLGRSEPSSSVLITGLLDAIAAITLRREMLEVIHNKYPTPTPLDDLCWPSIKSDGSLAYPPQRCKDTPDVSDEQDGYQDVGGEDLYLRGYWNSVRERYHSAALDSETLSSPVVAELPPHWTVVHITITDDKSTLFISRQRGGGRSTDHPLMFCIPLKGRREGPGEDENQQLTFEDAMEEFNDIIRLNNETTKTAASIRENQVARAVWWKERGALDTRLQQLLENIEFCWLGAFKTILNKSSHLSEEGISSLRIQFDGVFQQGLRLQDKKTKEKALGHTKVPSESRGPNRVTLDDALVECFSTLSSQCRDEELEDLVYFILDLYQFHGVPVAIAEIDIDQVVVDLRSVLEDHATKFKSASNGLPSRKGAFGHTRSTQNGGDEHLFLVLDKNVQGLPWESIPILRGRSISRVPCMSFLLDRLHFPRWRQERESITTSPAVDQAVVDPRNGYYILNPSGDLTRTEERFKPWVKEMESIGWQGICGRQPSELEVLRALEQHDVVVYFGHGGAEQYVRSHKIRNLRKCAAVMLWGCSSGFLRDMGDFDRVGTPLNYMLAGCPTLVANLWDVTDKDLDTFSQEVFDKLKMNAAHVRECGKESGRAPKTSLMTAVAESRNVCKLRYLTGAAPVVYGIPFYL
ncbi:hypothetical protein E1B28_006233 [Marasmius oreades]|uniref:separase n=1 Tax=Marasmius oreades TaxID=181124 RepID=A0A9P7UWC5_9AGAR|nr:uncharacterized protein E1B28_006233 [Marasmius oreades]KAG7095494.1 hypothetical protein E1B28_006233 [Marasmius oreades]